MIVKAKSLIIALDADVKLWAQIGCSRRLFYRVLAGRRVTQQNAAPFIVAARNQFGPEVTGIEIGGEVHYAPDAVTTLQTRHKQLEARFAELEAQLAFYQQLAMRRVLTTADFRPLAN